MVDSISEDPPGGSFSFKQLQTRQKNNSADEGPASLALSRVPL